MIVSVRFQSYKWLLVSLCRSQTAYFYLLVGMQQSLESPLSSNGANDIRDGRTILNINERLRNMKSSKGGYSTFRPQRACLRTFMNIFPGTWMFFCSSWMTARKSIFLHASSESVMSGMTALRVLAGVWRVKCDKSIKGAPTYICILVLHASAFLSTVRNLNRPPRRKMTHVGQDHVDWWSGPTLRTISRWMTQMRKVRQPATLIWRLW